ncbi:hypothetical protein [Chitinibacter sp. GC72]|uniref:hypothetical protein n=1 Tax=Chitinibacter sp. GC72 TaxID=1526917 RepID=UPI0012FC53D0|nr:hypothetical protein [Chitinibacter sp. GC72]
MASINDFALNDAEMAANHASNHLDNSTTMKALKAALAYTQGKSGDYIQSAIDNYLKPIRMLKNCAEILSRTVGYFIVRTGHSRSAAPAIRTTGNNVTKSSSSGSSDPDPEPRRQRQVLQTRLDLARALTATTQFVGGAR